MRRSERLRLWWKVWRFRMSCNFWRLIDILSRKKYEATPLVVVQAYVWMHGRTAELPNFDDLAFNSLTLNGFQLDGEWVPASWYYIKPSSHGQNWVTVDFTKSIEEGRIMP